MTEAAQHLKDLKDIRSMMERSSRFISLSGLSGIFAGIFALIGAAVAYWYLDMKLNRIWGYDYEIEVSEFYLFFFTDAAIVLILALSAGLFFTIRQSKRKGQSIWDNTSKRLLINTAIPLGAGGLFCLALLFHNTVGLIAPATLIFYGLALLNGSKYTLEDIRYLAYCEIGLGLIATILLVTVYYSGRLASESSI